MQPGNSLTAVLQLLLEAINPRDSLGFFVSTLFAQR